MNIDNIYSKRLSKNIATYLAILLTIITSVTFLDMKAQCASATIKHALKTDKIELIKYCAKEKIPEAIIGLSSIYAEGKIVPKDHKKAFGLCQRAALEGNIDAMYCLGNFYNKAVGTEQNHKQAYYWFTQAANQQHEAATLELAYCYLNGVGTTQNIKKAKQLLSNLATNGNAAAVKALSEN